MGRSVIACAAVALMLACSGCFTSRHHYQYRVPKVPAGSNTAVGTPAGCTEQCRVGPPQSLDACLAQCPGVVLYADCEPTSEMECIASQKSYRRKRSITPVGIALAAGFFGILAGVGAALNKEDGKESYWYDVAAVDAAALSLGVASAISDKPGLGYASLGLYAAGAPVVHWAVNDTEHAYISLGLRLGVPLTLGALQAIGSFIGECNPVSLAVDRAAGEALEPLDRALEREVVVPDASTGACIRRRAKAVMLVGAIGAALLDAAIVAARDGDDPSIGFPLLVGSF